MLMAAVFAGGCRKDDKSVFSKSPDDRINETLGNYQKALTGSSYGWTAMLTTANGGTYNFYMQFNASNRVFMYSDIDTGTAGNRKESSYRLKALQQPSLIFDTYTYIHQLADPNPNVNGGAYGQGLNSDFEFSLDTLTTDSIRLTGRFKGSRMVMKKATQADRDQWASKAVASTMSGFLNLNNIFNYFKQLQYNGVSYEINVDAANHKIRFTWVDAGGAHQTTVPYYYSGNALVLATPFTNGSQTISSIANPTWDGANQILNVTVNSSAAAIVGATAPLNPDLNAPLRWWQTAVRASLYWVSLNGFHVNGVDDAYHVTQIPNYYFLIYWPQFGTSGGITYDLQGFVKNISDTLRLAYGAAYRPPSFTSDGRVIFTIYGTLGMPPPSENAAFVNTTNQMRDPSGYYLVQTSTGTYDMVSAKDAKAWITWLFPR